MTKWAVWLVVVACAAPHQDTTSTSPSPQRKQPRIGFSESILDTAPGLSGVRADATGFLWAVPERERRLFRIEVTERGNSLEEVPIVDVLESLELEDITVLDGERFAFGAEGAVSASAAVVVAKRDATNVRVTHVIDIPEQALGLHLQRNEGVEGLCNIGETMFAAIESSSVEAGRRWSPLVRLENGRITNVQRIWLTTNAGRISALDCREHDGAIEAIAIERNFYETKLLTFVLSDQLDIDPRVVLDLGPSLHNRLNLEGITWFHGRLAAVNDNQWRGVTGPSELIIFGEGVISP